MASWPSAISSHGEVERGLEAVARRRRHRHRAPAGAAPRRGLEGVPQRDQLEFGLRDEVLQGGALVLGETRPRRF